MISSTNFERASSPDDKEEVNKKDEQSLNKRIKDLERTNLSLRRMLEVMENNHRITKTSDISKRIPSQRYLTLNRSLTETPLGPPM